MLTQLFSSNIRVRILKFLIMHANSEFTTAEMAQKTGSVVRSINKELVKLLRTKSVIETTKPLELNKKVVNVKHYKANPEFFMFEEIYSVFLKLQVHDLEIFKDKLKKMGDVEYIALTGRFTGVIDTDIDVLIVGSISKSKCAKIISEFEKVIGWEINWSLMDSDDFLYRKDVGDMFMHNILMAKKIEVVNKFD